MLKQSLSALAVVTLLAACASSLPPRSLAPPCSGLSRKRVICMLFMARCCFCACSTLSIAVLTMRWLSGAPSATSMPRRAMPATCSP